MRISRFFNLVNNSFFDYGYKWKKKKHICIIKIFTSKQNNDESDINTGIPANLKKEEWREIGKSYFTAIRLNREKLTDLNK